MANEIQAEGSASNKIENVPGVTATDLINMRRKTLDPYTLVSYLPPGSDYTTGTIASATPTKVLIPTTVKYQNGIILNPTGGTGGTGAFEKSSAGTQKFDITATTGMQSGVNNTIVRLMMYKNGVLENGVSVPRKVGTGTDTGAVPLHGVFELAQGDYIEVFVETSLESTIIFVETSIDIRERN
jgi:hypothetical protein